MSAVAAPSAIEAEFRRRTPQSAELARAAREVFPSGLTHDSRHLTPYPIYVDRATGSRKWDVDGNEYVDYMGGHGSLLLGHNHPRVVAAIAAQATRGEHYGAAHELELRWAQLVQRLIPSAEQVRFTSSGTEATLLAMRLARAYSGRSRILRFAGHFHGWHDHVAFGIKAPWNTSPSPGVVDGIASEIDLVTAGEVAAVEEVLAREQTAAVMLEPTGASWGQIPTTPEFLATLRRLTTKYSTVLLFDEVISGFRCTPGGAQAFYGITPDLTTLAKILAGGLPGGAVVGRREIMEWLAFPTSGDTRNSKIPHHGTHNAHLLSAAAGIAALETIVETNACERANEYAATLREQLAAVTQEEKLDWVVYGSFSGFHIFTNPEHRAITAEEIMSGRYDHRVLQAPERTGLRNKLRLAMLLSGIDIFSWPGGPTSAVHTPADLTHTVQAFRESIARLRAEGEITTS